MRKTLTDCRLKAVLRNLLAAVVLPALFCLSALERETTALGSAAVHQVPPSEAKTSEQVYKNIQVLKGLPASELDGVMEFMSAALGVGCTHCHTNSWDSDAKSAKLGTRRMILMTRAINKENFSDNPAITCYTCHHGQPRTVPLPPLDLAVSEWTSQEAPETKPAITDSADAIIERYIRAIGGVAAIEKIKTKVLRGTETTNNRMTAAMTTPIEIYQSIGNKLLMVRSGTGRSDSHGFDGSRGWTKDSRGVRDIDAKEQAGIRREADFYRYLKIKETYPQMRVLSKERVGGRDAYVVGATSRDDSRERLYFDAETGLLIRRYVTYRTAFGGIPEVTDFNDYREVDGIKLPFTIRWSRPPFSFERKFSKVAVNVTVDDSRFKPPTR